MSFPLRVFVFFITSTLPLFGCAPKILSTAEQHYGLMLSRQLISAYGEYPNPLARQYLEYLKERLVGAIPPGRKAAYAYRFVMLDTAKPLAFSPGGGYIMISKGLIKTLANEGELAFVLCHELAHQQLGHTRYLLRGGLDEGFLPYHREMELEADRYAVGLMALAGYDPRLAPFALTRSYRALDRIPTDSHYPDLDARIAAIHEMIKNSTWRPPGTMDRRAFQELRMLL